MRNQQTFTAIDAAAESLTQASRQLLSPLELACLERIGRAPADELLTPEQMREVDVIFHKVRAQALRIAIRKRADLQRRRIEKAQEAYDLLQQERAYEQAMRDLSVRLVVAA
ncbi:hypothetical protein JM946_12675 [Steroidobacter sp. S1-65]|uniref:Uncharacterized protein n=1 Tax=Steroidobacter gossypii TaxID=2805490 RepID=A0ABS1WXC0_9GAMM|nr:hypothetical protein [Steroidobacter gossypii]MBM0105613.1 hypothetical protein [Steroidobacter gossypii]